MSHRYRVHAPLHFKGDFREVLDLAVRPERLLAQLAQASGGREPPVRAAGGERSP